MNLKKTDFYITILLAFMFLGWFIYLAYNVTQMHIDNVISKNDSLEVRIKVLEEKQDTIIIKLIQQQQIIKK